MNNKGNYKRGNRLKIIKALYATMGIAYRDLQLFEGQTLMTQRMVVRMKKEGLIEVTKTACGKVITLAEDQQEKYIQYLTGEYLESYRNNKPELSKSLNNERRMERLLKNSEIQIMMHMGGVPSYPDENVGLPEILLLDYIGYHGSKEIKKESNYQVDVDYTNDGMKKILGSRINGMLASPGGIYAVYNISNHLIEWDKGTEVKMSNHIERLLANRYEVQQKRKINCLLITHNIETLAKVITNENDERKKKGKRKHTLLNIDYAYDNVYGIPANKSGIDMIRIMSSPNWNDIMRHALLWDIEPCEDYSIPCAGYKEEDGYVLLFCDGNLTMLKLFLKRACNRRPDEVFTIYCFDFQLPLLVKLGVLEYVNVKQMKLEEYKTILERMEKEDE